MKKAEKQSGSKVLFIGDTIEEWLLVQHILVRRNDEVRRASCYEEIYAATEEMLDLIIICRITSYNDDSVTDDGIAVYKKLREIPAFQKIPVLLWRVGIPRKIYPIAQSLGIAGCISFVSTPDDLIAARDAALQGGVYYPPLR